MPSSSVAIVACDSIVFSHEESVVTKLEGKGD
jgi:hypothetical protein